MSGSLKSSIKGVIDGRLRAAFLRRARPLMVSPGGGACLVLAPHPDDETLGCGHLIARMVEQGRRVHVAIVADGSGCRLSSFRPPAEVVAIRRAEALNACAELGLPTGAVEFLALPDASLTSRKDELAAHIVRIVAEVKPASIFSPFVGEAHPDHRALAEVVHALRVSGGLQVPVFEYPIWLPTKLAGSLLLRPSFRRNLRSLRSPGNAATKRRAIAAYRSQASEYEGVRIDGALSDEFVDLFLAHGEVYFGSGRVA